METPTTETPEFSGSATYCPEDNKLRLYVGRVPRDEYLALKAQGWQALHKQRETGGGDFAAIWTPERRDTALEYAGIIEDEDKGPGERAIERAERFAVYREKRTAEAVGHADRFDAGPAAHGYQSQARAERSARRHDAVAGRAVDSWSKAEYWQSRTAGVISHALHVAAPGVRVGRIKTIEAELRKVEAQRAALIERWRNWEKVAAMTDPDKQTALAETLAGFGYSSAPYKHPHNGREGSLWDFLRDDAKDRITGAEAAAMYFKNRTSPDSEMWNNTRLADWVTHYKLRLAYENQMIEAQGGRAAFVEMEVGGWIGNRQIRKVNKSNASGRVVSVTLKCKGSRHDSKAPGFCLLSFNIERLPTDAYRAPTPEDLAALAAEKSAEKEAAPKKDPCPLINPTDEDAQKLQELWNAAEHRSKYASSGPSRPLKMTFAQYSGRGTAVVLCETGHEHRSRYGKNITRSDVLKVRTIYGENYCARRVVILTDKPQKGIPWAALEKAKAAAPSLEKLTPRLAEIAGILGKGGYSSDYTPAEHALLRDAEYVKWVNLECSRAVWTDAGAAALKQYRDAGPKSALFGASEVLA